MTSDIFSSPSNNHIAYQPAVGHSLRHARFGGCGFFYPYVVPPGQIYKQHMTAFYICEYRPVRDEIWVDKTNHTLSHRAVRYGIYRNLLQGSLPTANHIAYQPAVGHGLRHAAYGCHLFFYSYLVPPGQTPSVKSNNP